MKTSKTIKIGKSELWFKHPHDENDKGLCYLITKSKYIKSLIICNYKNKKYELEKDESFEIPIKYTGRLKLIISDPRLSQKQGVVAILPDLLGENCYVSISAKTIAEAIRDGLLCEDGSFYGPFEFFIGSGNSKISII